VLSRRDLAATTTLHSRERDRVRDRDRDRDYGDGLTLASQSSPEKLGRDSSSYDMYPPPPPPPPHMTCILLLLIARVLCVVIMYSTLIRALALDNFRADLRLQLSIPTAHGRLTLQRVVVKTAAGKRTESS
jgi:hypothetical protein